MPIEVQNQPGFGAVGQAAYDAGFADFLNRERARQQAIALQQQEMAQRERLTMLGIGANQQSQQFQRQAGLERMAFDAHLDGIERSKDRALDADRVAADMKMRADADAAEMAFRAAEAEKERLFKIAHAPPVKQTMMPPAKFKMTMAQIDGWEAQAAAEFAKGDIDAATFAAYQEKYRRQRELYAEEPQPTIEEEFAANSLTIPDPNDPAKKILVIKDSNGEFKPFQPRNVGAEGANAGTADQAKQAAADQKERDQITEELAKSANGKRPSNDEVVREQRRRRNAREEQKALAEEMDIAPEISGAHDAYDEAMSVIKQHEAHVKDVEKRIERDEKRKPTDKEKLWIDSNKGLIARSRENAAKRRDDSINEIRKQYNEKKAAEQGGQPSQGQMQVPGPSAPYGGQPQQGVSPAGAAQTDEAPQDELVPPPPEEQEGDPPLTSFVAPEGHGELSPEQAESNAAVAMQYMSPDNVAAADSMVLQGALLQIRNHGDKLGLSPFMLSGAEYNIKMELDSRRSSGSAYMPAAGQSPSQQPIRPPVVSPPGQQPTPAISPQSGPQAGGMGTEAEWEAGRKQAAKQEAAKGLLQQSIDDEIRASTTPEQKKILDKDLAREQARQTASTGERRGKLRGTAPQGPGYRETDEFLKWHAERRKTAPVVRTGTGYEAQDLANVPIGAMYVDSKGRDSVKVDVRVQAQAMGVLRPFEPKPTLAELSKRLPKVTTWPEFMNLPGGFLFIDANGDLCVKPLTQ